MTFAVSTPPVTSTALSARASTRGFTASTRTTAQQLQGFPRQIMRFCTVIAALTCVGTALASVPNVSKVNGSISIAPNQQAGNVSTVNGPIHIGDKAAVADAHTVNGPIVLGDGSMADALSTVNGSITLGEASTAASLTTVNGAIRLASSGRVSGPVNTVNGSITLERSADVAGRVSSDNGPIRLHAAHVHGGIKTASHDIDIGANSRVEDGILVQKRTGSWWDRWIRDWFPETDPPPRIVIGPGAVVSGTLKFERDVRVYVSDSATIGAVQGATAIAYSGDQPPG